LPIGLGGNICQKVLVKMAKKKLDFKAASAWA